MSYGPEAATAEWVIEPQSDSIFARIAEVWQFRRLLGYFASRQLKMLYRRSSFGWIWMMVRLCAPIGLNSLIFGGLLAVSSDDGTPYTLFLLCGQTTWILFDHSLMFITRSIERNRKLISRVYFPRLILPIAAVAPGLMFLMILAIVLVGSDIYLRYHFGIWYIPLHPRLLLTVVAVVISMAFAIAIGFWTSVLQLRYRDIRFGLRYTMPLLMYMTSVLWPLSHIKYAWARGLVALNPMESAIELFRYGTLGTPLQMTPPIIAAHMVTIAVTAGMGIWFFNRVESASVDKI